MGVSYDAPTTLARFSKKRGIRFPLLSDSGSATIDAYGLRNQAATGRYAGIPHPATILLDSQGVVRAKLFHEGYKRRHSAAEILSAAQAID